MLLTSCFVSWLFRSRTWDFILEWGAFSILSIIYPSCAHVLLFLVLPGKPHGRRSLVGCSPWDREESDTTEQLHFYFSLSCIGEGNGNSLRRSCLENPRDGGAWWAAVYGVAQSRIRLKRLSSSSSFYLFVIIIFIYLLAVLGLSLSMWDLVPSPGIKPRPPTLGCRVLATGSPGKSQSPVVLLLLAETFVQVQALQQRVPSGPPTLVSYR